MNRKDIQHITLKPAIDKVDDEEINSFETAEDITIKSIYKKEDIKNLKHTKFAAGIPPFLRGPYATMYTKKPWTIRQYASFSTAEESNSLYKRNLNSEKNGLSVAFNLTTHSGYDGDHERIIGEVNKTSVTINTVEDMKILFDRIPLDQISILMTINGAILPILAFFIVAAEEKGISQKQLSGTIQNDILKEFMVRNDYTYPPTASMQIIAGILKYTSTNMPKFNRISISGCHILEAGGTTEIELAYTLADGIEFLREVKKAGLTVDDIAPHLCFFFRIGMNHFMEIAKLRAARMLWTKLVKQFNPKNEKSLKLRTHCQTTGWSLIEQNSFNNVSRTTIEAMAAVLGGTQSLHTKALNKKIAKPTNFSARIARNAQLYIAEETKLTKTVDPWAGSYYVESLTHEISQKAWELIEEIEELGGMTKAIEAGIPKMRIEEAITKKQARIVTDRDKIIDVNCYQLEKKEPLNILEIENKEAHKQHLDSSKKLTSERNQEKVADTLKQLRTTAEEIQKTIQPNKNLLALAIEAARARATLSEISNAIEVISF
ncbi:methylmalonyl-CoA mutase [Cellulophaga baltica]|nr:methylmalonyl-CoA mutase [Cellulophaga baltica]